MAGLLPAARASASCPASASRNNPDPRPAHAPGRSPMTAAHRLYVGTIGEGLWRSTDGGATFVRACDGMFVECHVRALAAHPRDPRTLYLGSEQGLYRSTDG